MGLHGALQRMHPATRQRGEGCAVAYNGFSGSLRGDYHMFHRSS